MSTARRCRNPRAISSTPIDLIDGISLPDLITKRTEGMMQPQLRKQVEGFYPGNPSPMASPAMAPTPCASTFYSLASTGRDIKFDIGRMAGFRNFCNKIWNAARYALMNCEGKPVAAAIDPTTCTVADRWIIDRFDAAAGEVHQAMEQYRFDNASRSLYVFFWDEFCDWYVELSKPVLWNEDENPAAAAMTRRVLLEILERSLRLLHPFMPFISEEVWQRIAPPLAIKGDSIMLQPFPEATGEAPDAEAAADIAWLQQIVTAVRNIRGEMDVSPARQVPVLLRSRPDRLGQDETAGKARLGKYRRYLTQLAKLESIDWLAGEAPAAATSIGAATECTRAARRPDRCGSRTRPARPGDRQTRKGTGIPQGQTRQPWLHRQCTGKSGRRRARTGSGNDGAT